MKVTCMIVAEGVIPSKALTVPIPLTRSEMLRTPLKPRGDEPAPLPIVGGLVPARAKPARRAGLRACA